MKKLIVAITICLSFCMPARAGLLPGLFNLGLAYWGFSQENAFGNVAGSVFALRGTIHILTIRW